MFAKKFRLPAIVSFSHAQTFSSQSFIVRMKKNELSYNRYGFVVTKKVSKRAHVRNRTKRKFRACVEKFAPRVTQGYDIIFMLTPGTVTESSERLCKELEKTSEKFLTA